METIKIKTKAFYNDLKYYKVMPPEIFNAIELAELKSAKCGKEVLAEVPKDLFEKMISDINSL